MARFDQVDQIGALAQRGDRVLWLHEHGGQLRLHLADGPVAVLPAAGTCVLFRSDAVLHEVLPATRPRLSVTAWLRRRPAGLP